MPKARQRLLSSIYCLVIPVLIVTVGGLVSAPPACAQDALSGKYRCLRVELGTQSAPCQSPPLILNRDGSYEIWSERGTYDVVGGRWLVLSHSKRRGMGHFVAPRQIVFEYRIGGRQCRVIFRRIFEPSNGVRWS